MRSRICIWPGNMSNVTVITRKQLEAIRAKAGHMVSQVMLLCKQACWAQASPSINADSGD